MNLLALPPHEHLPCHGGKAVLSLGVDSPKQIFAFFDLDHTLVPFDTQTMFCDFVLKRERARTWRHFFFLPVAILKGLKLVKTVTAKRAFMSYLGGIKMAKVRLYAQEFAQNMVKPWLFPEMLKIIEAHRRAGHTLILNTASPDFYAHEIAKVLGLIIASPHVWISRKRCRLAKGHRLK